MTTEVNGFAHSQVPEAAQGSGWKIFFIVAGSLCGLPVFILGAQVSTGLGFPVAIGAIATGTAVMALLGAVSAYAGSRTRMSLAMLSDLAFGRLGGRVVKLVIALSLVGWFGVNISVLGATASDSILSMTGLHLAAPFISIPVSLLIAVVAIRGASGLERLGMVLVPIVVLILIGSVAVTLHRLRGVLTAPGSGSLAFGGAVSAVIGSYMVGIIIQPDYGRFVRKPLAAALGVACALGVAFPIILLSSSFASLALDKPNLVGAMIALGFGAPALVVLFMGAWIDASACLYSGGLSLANQFKRFTLTQVIIAVTVVGITLSLLHAERVFLPFLMVLGVALPPVATVQVAEALGSTAVNPGDVALRWSAALGWLAGFCVGGLSYGGLWRLTGIPAFDSILVSALVVLVYRVIDMRARRTAQITDLRRSVGPVAKEPK